MKKLIIALFSLLVTAGNAYAFQQPVPPVPAVGAPFVCVVPGQPSTAPIGICHKAFIVALENSRSFMCFMSEGTRDWTVNSQGGFNLNTTWTLNPLCGAPLTGTTQIGYTPGPLACPPQPPTGTAGNDSLANGTYNGIPACYCPNVPNTTIHQFWSDNFNICFPDGLNMLQRIFSNEPDSNYFNY